MMIVVGIALLLGGLLLSGFFSGSETGFYRVRRVRLVMDSMEGDRASKSLLWLSNNPQLFVATTLVGNNVANYLTSLAVVLLASNLLPPSQLAELALPIVLSPIIFVYGELFPKNLFFQAPNRLLQQVTPWFLFFALIFAPISALLWSLGLVLEKLLGSSPVKVQSSLARKEIYEVISEGHDAGLLHNTQRYLAQNFFIHASKKVVESCRPLNRFPTLTEQSTVSAALRAARRAEIDYLPIRSSRTRQPIGFIRAAELLLTADLEQTIEPWIQPLATMAATELHGEALLKMQGERMMLAQVVNKSNETVGILTLDSLAAPLLSGPLSALRRGQ